MVSSFVDAHSGLQLSRVRRDGGALPTGAIDTTGMVRKAGGPEGSLLARTPQTHAQELPPLFQGLLQTACFDTGVWDKTADDAAAAIAPVATSFQRVASGAGDTAS
jgi:hypothetical protein